MRKLGALAAVAVAASAFVVAPPALAQTTHLGDLTVLATTDVHGHAVDYDYFTGAPFGASDPKKSLGMDHLATAIKHVRAQVGADSVITLDNGDIIQGSPLNTYYQNNRTPDSVDPMAKILNLLEYDATVAGNHEFNYGLDNLRQYQHNLNMPFLGANVLDVKTGQPYLTPYTMIERTVGGKTVKVGVIGVVTPGVRVWDKPHVEGILRFQDQVEAVRQWVPHVRAAGADVVVVLSHSGLDAEGYVWNPADLTENVSRSIAEHTSGVDLIIGGHSHVMNKGEVFFTNEDGKPVLYTQPYYWARSASRATLPLVIDEDGKICVNWAGENTPHATQLEAKDYPADPAVLEAIEPWHSQTQQWVRTVIAQSTKEMSAATSPWEDTPIVDFINMVQTEELTRALKGSEYEQLHVISQASPFSRSAVFHEGDVTIADMAGLYIYDNTLYGVVLTGKELRDYLEFSARYYKQQEEGAEISDWSTVTNAQYEGMTRGIPDYSYDELSGVNYHINISKPVGERIENLTLPDGTPVTDDMQFALAVNNYRWSGGSGYPHVTSAPVIYNDQKEIRELMIQWAQTNRVIDPEQFFVKNWTVSTSAAEPLPQPSTQPSQPVIPSVEPSVSASASTAPSASPGGTPSSPSGGLPATGADVATVFGLALMLMLAGGGAVALRRTRR